MTSGDAANARLDRRRRTHEKLAAWLAGQSDGEIAAALASVAWRGSVHGSCSGALEVGGERVFVKQVALSEVERGAEGSTANLFGLPLFYQYGVGSAGFGAWRELAAALKASAWALAGECAHFPLVYHWRVLPAGPRALSDTQRAWLARAGDYWDGSAAVGARLAATAAARWAVVLFVEHGGESLDAWLAAAVAAGRADAAFEGEVLRAHDGLRAAAAFANGRGMLHFDLNAMNVLRGGGDVWAADFGLAICDDFDLSDEERAFAAAHALYDRAYVDWAFVAWVRPLAGAAGPALRARVEACAGVARVMGRFLKGLAEGRKAAAVWPAEEVAAAVAAQG